MKPNGFLFFFSSSMSRWANDFYYAHMGLVIVGAVSPDGGTIWCVPPQSTYIDKRVLAYTSRGLLAYVEHTLDTQSAAVRPQQ